MPRNIFERKSRDHLHKLINEIPDRSVGSPGNLKATDYFKSQIQMFGWDVTENKLDVVDYKPSEAWIVADSDRIKLNPGPYSVGANLKAALKTISTIDELEKSSDIEGKILLLTGNIAKEQIMPKNFVFYNPEEHRKIIALLEEKRPAAIISATSRNSALAGGAYPFPLFEDGDFNIASAYTTDAIGEELALYDNREVEFFSGAKRIPSVSYNIQGIKGKNSRERIVVSAHIDSKKGSPGAIDNATGVTVLLLLSEMLKDYRGERAIELIPFNGEDYYSVPGQMAYIKKNEGSFKDILLNINIDGAGYRESKTAFSFFNLPEKLKSPAEKIIKDSPELLIGEPWPQGDHSIFVQFGAPAVAITSDWFIKNMDTQDITHTPKDSMDITSPEKLPLIAKSIKKLIFEIEAI